MGVPTMNIFKHYSNGTSHIDSDGEYHGYSPSRNEVILSVHIQIDDYHVHIYPDGISVQYKYIRVQPTYYTIGRWRYHVDALNGSRFNEKKRVLHMYDLLQEMLLEQRIGGIAINDWSVIKVIQSHAEETK